MTTISKGTNKKEIKLLLLQIDKKKSSRKNIDLNKYCGALKLQEDPVDIQKKWRDEWE
ncbi:hypothetical protein [Draconibacterium orientale]|uniref:hypothetical protein n=1 Tax=Draconibacterium orientale TaxID=1168034 RepID=UPI002A0A2BCC|nr:hypothetical protein [Draconibacterium orientale]